MRKPLPRPNIVKVYEHYELRIEGPDRGGWVKAQCPLPEHEDQNPSASINEDAGKWHCHACNESGDGLDIIQRREHVEFSVALDLASKFEDGEVAHESKPFLDLGGSRGKARRAAWSPPWKSL